MIRFFDVLILLMIAGTLPARAAFYSSGFNLPASTTVKVYVPQSSGAPVWFSVANASTNSYFIPSATAAEWTAFKNNLPASVTTTAIYPQSCKDILNYAIGATDGDYTIYPTSTSTPITSNCDMTTDSGGWTRLNASLASTTSSFGVSDDVSGTNIGQACAGSTPNVALSAISVPGLSQFRAVLTRTTTIMQCPVFGGVGSQTWTYLSSGSWTSATACGWGSPWSSATVNNISATGLPAVWKMTGTFSGTAVNFYSHCSGASDNGAYSIQFWVK